MPHEARAMTTPAPAYGPAMSILSPLAQLFISLLFDGQKPIAAGAAAGIRHKDPADLKAQVDGLMADPRVGDALVEEAKRRTVLLAPKAQIAIERLVEHPEHADHWKAVKLARDDAKITTQIPKTVDMNVKVEVTQREKLIAIRDFATKYGMDVKMLLGFDPDPAIGKIVEAEFTEAPMSPEEEAELTLEDRQLLGLP